MKEYIALQEYLQTVEPFKSREININPNERISAVNLLEILTIAIESNLDLVVLRLAIELQSALDSRSFFDAQEDHMTWMKSDEGKRAWINYKEEFSPRANALSDKRTIMRMNEGQYKTLVDHLDRHILEKEKLSAA